MNLSAQTIYDSCRDQFSGHFGSLEVDINAIGALETPKPGDIIFSDKVPSVALLDTPAAVIVLPEKTPPELYDKSKQTVFLSPNPLWAMATVCERFFAPAFMSPEKHPTAVISKTAKIGENVYLGAYVVIEDGAVLGDNCQIQAHCVIHSNAKIGAGSRLHSFVSIGRDCELGRNCLVQSHSVIGSWGFGYAHNQKGEHKHIPHLGKVVLEDGVEIGACCTIDRGTLTETRIGQGSTIDNQVHIAHNVKIGRHAILAGGFVVGGSTEIGHHFISGGRTTVIGHIRITDGVQVGGLSGVHNDIKEPGQYSGYPLLPISEYKKSVVSLRKINQIRSNVKKLMKVVFKDSQ